MTHSEDVTELLNQRFSHTLERRMQMFRKKKNYPFMTDVAVIWTEEGKNTGKKTKTR